MGVLAPPFGVGSARLLDRQGGVRARGKAVLFGLGHLAHAVELQRPLQMQGGDVALPHRLVAGLSAVLCADGVRGLVLGQGELVEPELVVAQGDTGVGVLGDHAVLDAATQCYLGVDQVLQYGVHIMLCSVLAEHEALPGPPRQGARPPTVAALMISRRQHEVDGAQRLTGAPQYAQGDDAHEMHPRRAVRQVTGRFSQGLLGQPQCLVVLPALRALEQPGHYCRVAAHALTLRVHRFIATVGP